MGVSYVKFCPRCQATVAVDAALCPNCGHHFRTHFQPPVSEKTIAMTSVPVSERPVSGARLDPEDEEAPRPIVRPRLILLGIIVLAIVGLVYGTQTRRAHEAVSEKISPAQALTFRPYDVTIQSLGESSAPVAPQSAADLKQWDATQTHSSGTGDATAGDTPAHVHLYVSKRILLVAVGTPARVLVEQGPWRRIQILSGPYQGKTGYVSRTHISLAPPPAGSHP